VKRIEIERHTRWRERRGGKRKLGRERGRKRERERDREKEVKEKQRRGTRGKERKRGESSRRFGKGCNQVAKRGNVLATESQSKVKFE